MSNSSIFLNLISVFFLQIVSVALPGYASNDGVTTFLLKKQELAFKYAEEGTQLLTEQKYKEALIALDKAIFHYPNHAFFYCLRSFIYNGLEKPQQAIADANQAIVLNPDEGLSYIARGLAHFQLQNHTEVQKDLLKGAKLMNLPIEEVLRAEGIILEQLEAE